MVDGPARRRRKTLITNGALFAGLGMLVFAAGGFGAGFSVNRALDETPAVPASKHASREPGHVRQFVMDLEQDKYAAQCVTAIRRAAAKRATVDQVGSLAAKVYVARAANAGIPKLTNELLKRSHTLGAATPEIIELQNELKTYEAPGGAYYVYEATFIQAKIVGLYAEALAPGQYGVAAGLTADGIDCLQMGFDFLGDQGQHLGTHLRQEYDRQQAAQQAAKREEGKALEAAKQAEKARHAELAKQAAKQRAKEQAAKQARPQAPQEQAPEEQAPEEQAPEEQAPEEQIPEEQAPEEEQQSRELQELQKQHQADEQQQNQEQQQQNQQPGPVPFYTLGPKS